MANYSITDTRLNGLANSINAITGETAKLSPANMETKLTNVIDTVGDQADIIDQISQVLNAKGGGALITDTPVTVTENGVINTPDGVRYNPITVNVSGGGGGVSASGAGVKFIDYDGTLVNFWPASDVASKIALPANPTGHTRLVAEGWNWSLANIKSYMANYPEAVMTVGQMYHTASGKTELDITLTKVTGLEVTCRIAGERDWGDGTTDTESSHTYANYGDYTIKCSGKVFSTNVFGTSKNICTAVYISYGTTSIRQGTFTDCHSITAVTIPNSVTNINRAAFSDCLSLISVTIPDGVYDIGSGTFLDCYSLTSIAIPNSVTNIDEIAFENCYSLATVAIPNDVTIIGAEAFAFCYSLTTVTISGSVTDIDEFAFSNCPTTTKYDFSAATAVPSLADTTAFDSINDICKIIVPNALYDEWKAATNWSTYANYIYKVSEVTG